VRNFNTILSLADRSFIQKISKETELIGRIGQMDLTDICKVFHLTVTQYTFFSAAFGIFSQ
jgi:hypothetical protein